MKTSNIVVFVILAILSAFLLGLWYYLGFNQIDNPLDLVLSICWWILMVVFIVAIVKLEKTRKERIRTVYVGESQMFNPEAGLTALGAEGVMGAIANVLDDLDYGFNKQDFPEKDTFTPKYFVRSSEYKKDETWKGEVVVANTSETKQFSSKEELEAVIAAL